MAKVAKPKKREASTHSRASRRQASPQPELSRSKSNKEADNGEQWMYNAQNTGISKKNKVKKLTHAQRVRQSKAVERAEKNMDVLERKVAESKQKSRKIQARRQDWDDLNGAPATAEAKGPTSKVQGDTQAEAALQMDGVEAGFEADATKTAT